MSESTENMIMLDVFNPYSGSLIKQIATNTAEDVEQALARAQALFEDRSAWLPAYQRIEILERVAQIMGGQFVEILKEAGLPDGWCQALVVENEDAEKLVVDERVNFFSFIGSAAGDGCFSC